MFRLQRERRDNAWASREVRAFMRSRKSTAEGKRHVLEASEGDAPPLSCKEDWFRTTGPFGLR